MERPDMMVLQELMDDMGAMDYEKMKKKKRGGGAAPSITIVVGGKPEVENETENEDAAMMSGPSMELEEEGDDMGESAMCDEACAMGIENPEEMDPRLLKKLMERKRRA